MSHSTATNRLRSRSAFALAVAALLFTACAPEPPPPAVAVREPARVIGLPGSGPNSTCDGTDAVAHAGGSADGQTLTPTEAARTARSIVSQSDAAPLAVTTVDDAGRPEIHPVDATTPHDTAASVREIAQATVSDGGQVLAVETDHAVHTDAAPITNDPIRPSQWALAQFDFEGVWTRGNGTGVCVAIVDTGVQVDHPDLASRVVASNDWTGEGTALAGNHGTHVAGIIAAVPDNGVGVVGAAPGVDLLNAKVLTAAGSGLDSSVASGVIWSVDQGADIINLSLGSSCANVAPISCRSTAMQLAVDYARDHDVLVVASGGNDGTRANLWSWPAAFDWPIAVASISSNGLRSSFSTIASYVDIAAPGENIRSTIANSGYGDLSGTSMAAPYVTALAALVRSTHPGESSAQLRDRIVDTATDRGAPGPDPSYGQGVIDPAAATA